MAVRNRSKRTTQDVKSHLRCAVCHAAYVRIYRGLDDGGFGVCRCGGTLVRVLNANKRNHGVKW